RRGLNGAGRKRTRARSILTMVILLIVRGRSSVSNLPPDSLHATRAVDLDADAAHHGGLVGGKVHAGVRHVERRREAPERDGGQEAPLRFLAQRAAGEL